MEELTPELERRIQVEELWGRRIVLEETMNAWRIREYQSHRLLSLLHSEDCAHGVRSKSPMPTCINKVNPLQPSANFGGRRAAMIVVLTASGWFLAQQAYNKLLTSTFFLSAHEASRPSHEINLKIEAPTSKHGEDLWKGPTTKQRPLDADLKRIFGSSL